MAHDIPSATSIFHHTAYPSISPLRPELSAKGKTILVTGGGTGIGAETARRFAQAGASRIALLGRREQPLLETKASIEHEFANVEFVAPTDIAKKDEVDAAFAKFVGQRGKIDVVVSNASANGPVGAVDDLDPDMVIDHIQQDLKGALVVAQAFIRHASANDPVAINVSSGAAHVNAGHEFQTYSIAKWSVFRLWDSVAHKNPGVRLYHVQPGVVDTAMCREGGGIALAGWEDHVSLPASFFVWLASPEGRFLKGKYLWANWDADELKAKAKELEASTQLTLGLVGWPFQNGEHEFPGGKSS